MNTLTQKDIKVIPENTWPDGKTLVVVRDKWIRESAHLQSVKELEEKSDKFEAMALKSDSRIFEMKEQIQELEEINKASKEYINKLEAINNQLTQTLSRYKEALEKIRDFPANGTYIKEWVDMKSIANTALNEKV